MSSCCWECCDCALRYDEGSSVGRLSKGLGSPSWETTRLKAGPDLLLVAKIRGVPMGQYISVRPYIVGQWDGLGAVVVPS